MSFVFLIVDATLAFSIVLLGQEANSPVVGHRSNEAKNDINASSKVRPDDGSSSVVNGSLGKENNGESKSGSTKQKRASRSSKTAYLNESEDEKIDEAHECDC